MIMCIFYRYYVLFFITKLNLTIIMFFWSVNKIKFQIAILLMEFALKLTIKIYYFSIVKILLMILSQLINFKTVAENKKRLFGYIFIF